MDVPVGLVPTSSRMQTERYSNQYEPTQCEAKEHTVGSDERAKGVEEPSVAVQLFLVLLLQTKDDLHRASTSGYLARLGHDDLRSVLENMGGNILATDAILGNALLVATHQVEDLEGTLVDLGATIGDNADYNLLPAVRAPHLRAGAAAKEGDVLDDSIHCPNEEDFVFVVHCQDNEELRSASIEIRPEGILLAHKLIGVTCGRGVAHLGELLALF